MWPVTTGRARPDDADGPSRVKRKLSRTMLRTVADYRLVEAGDRILVAISGGKDSYTLLDLLWRARRRAPIRYELIAFHLDQGQPGYDGRPLRDWIERFGAPFEALSTDQRTSICDDICQPVDEGSELASGSEFFALVRNLTAGAFWTTEEGLADLQYVGNTPLPKWELPPAAVLEHLGLT